MESIFACSCVEITNEWFILFFVTFSKLKGLWKNPKIILIINLNYFLLDKVAFLRFYLPYQSKY